VTRLALSLPPGYAPVPATEGEREALRATAPPAGRARLDAGLDALAAASAARGVVTTGALALDGSTTGWLAVAVTGLPGGPVDGERLVPGLADLLRTRYPAADVRPVVLAAGPAVRVEQHGHLELPGGRVGLVDVRHLLPTSGGREVVSAALQALDADPGLVGRTADRIAAGLRLGSDAA
jgi:hypothetical protein